MSDDDPMPDRLQAGSMNLTWLVVAGLAALAAISILWSEPTLRGLALCGFPAVFAAGAWILYGRPHVRATPEGVVLANPFRDIAIHHRAVRHTDTTYGLQLRTAEGKHSAWALTDMSSKRARTQRQKDGNGATPEAGQVLNHLEKLDFLARNEPDAAAPPVEARPAVLPIAVAGLAVVWFVAALFAL